MTQSVNELPPLFLNIEIYWWDNLVFACLIYLGFCGSNFIYRVSVRIGIRVWCQHHAINNETDISELGISLLYPRDLNLLR